LLRAFLRRDFGIALSYRVPFVVDAFQSVLTVAFLYFLARVVGHKVIAATGLKVSYFGFAVIGSVLIGILTVSLASFSRRIRTDQMTGTLEVLFSLPPRPWLVVLSSASYQVIYAIITSAITLAVSFWLGLRFHVTGLSIGVALADFIGGVLYPVQDLSHPLRIIADLLPFTWALEVMRAALLGAQSDLIRLAEVWAVTIVAFPVSIWVFSYALTHAKKKGTVGQY
jgi:ABC-type multidrug transport system permease subunit